MKSQSFKLPEFWKIETIPSLLFFQEGPGVRNWQFKENGVKLLNVGNINNGRLNLDATSIYLSEEEAYGKYAHFLIDAGDLVIASSGIVVDNFHNKIAFVESKHLPLCMNTSTIRFKTLDKDVLDIRYFRVFLRTNFFKNQLKRLITGTAQLNFGPSHLKKIYIPLPPINDQTRIATLLSRIETLIAARKDNLRLLEEFLKSTFLEMFGDPVRNEKQWKKESLEKHADSRLGKMRDKQFITGNHLYPYIGNSHVRWFEINTSDLLEMDFNEREKETFSLKYGDLLICEGGEIGRCAIWKNQRENCYFQKALHRVRLKKSLKNEFIQYVFFFYSKRDGFKNVSSKSTIAHLTGVKLKETLLPIPPIELQNQFAAIVEKTESLKTRYQQNLTELENLYAALSQKAFKGELDLSLVPLAESDSNPLA